MIVVLDRPAGGAGGDDCEAQEKQAAGDVREPAFVVQPRQRITDGLERTDGLRADKHREEDAANRTARDQP